MMEIYCKPVELVYRLRKILSIFMMGSFKTFVRRLFKVNKSLKRKQTPKIQPFEIHDIISRGKK